MKKTNNDEDESQGNGNSSGLALMRAVHESCYVYQIIKDVSGLLLYYRDAAKLHYCGIKNNESSDKDF